MRVSTFLRIINEIHGVSLVVPRLCLLITLSFSLCVSGRASEVLPLPLGVSYVSLTAGSSAPLPLGNSAQGITLQNVRIISETEPTGLYSISVGARAGGDGMFLAAPRTMIPGKYTVRISLIDDQGRQYTGGVPVILEAAAPIPQTERPPVVLVNGFDTGSVLQGACTLAEDSTATFGQLETFLTADGSPVVFFDNCVYGAPPLEVLGAELGNFIRALERDNGSAVEEVDVVAFSMGALVARSYLSGKQEEPGMFAPPADPKIRKLVLVAGEHFGAPIANLVNTGEQVPQLKPGSRFTWDLNTWHQGFDDLREVDALAIAGTGGANGTSDGVAPLAGASLSSSIFFNREPERTRILTACHNHEAAAFSLCNTNNVIMNVDAEDHPSGRIIRSFLAGTDEWRQIGETPMGNAVLASQGTVYFALKDADDALVTDVTGVSAADPEGMLAKVPLHSGPANIFLAELITGGSYEFQVARPSGNLAFATEVTAGGGSAIEAKVGPQIVRILPSAGVVDTLSVAADSLISLYGLELANSEASAPDGIFPLPTQLADAVVTANDEPLGLLYAGPTQINALLPPGLTGLLRIKVMNTSGEHQIGVMVDDAVPAIFTLDGSGEGPAAAVHALVGETISQNSPTSIGGLVSLYATGLGALAKVDGLLQAVIQPEVFVGGVAASVGYAGEAPGFVGLNQINIEIRDGTPTGPAVPVSGDSGEGER
jgi:uncharacterized protein (TIGR03437 family)